MNSESIPQFSRMLMTEEPLLVSPTLAARIGLNRAMFLQQLTYWLKKPSAHEHDGRRWVYNTYEQWHEQFPFWTPEAIRKIVSQLESKGLIITTARYNKRAADKTKWYTIDFAAVDSVVDPPEESTETLSLNPPDKSTEPPDKSTEPPDKSTERYQRLPESTRDSDLQSGEVPETKAPSPIKVINVKGWIVKQLMDRVNAARDRGARILKPTEDQKKTLASITEANWKDYEVDEFLRALDYMVAKAAGEVDGQPSAWCYIGTALDAINDGWKPGDARSSKDEPINPHSDKAQELRDKPRRLDVYLACYPDVPEERIRDVLAQHPTHSAITQILDGRESA